ncbi:MAG: hypothetical protein NTX17_06715 [Candidatus Eisenbacteria bacterium]|nr:hypothetical protein [Candidatus Eisenbacteria bacterium]
MDEQLAFLKSIVSRLNSIHIPYMLTGSMAMAVYAPPRMTRDIDFVIECQPQDAERLAKLFESDSYVDVGSIREAATQRSMFNIIHNKWIIKADFIVRKGDEYREEEFGRRRPFDVEGTTIYVVTPEDLILSKLVWSRESSSELHLRDTRAIIDNVTNLDWAYLERWAVALCVAQLLHEVRHG